MAPCAPFWGDSVATRRHHIGTATRGADMPEPFDLTDFLPYVLNRASEAAGQGFSAVYKGRYGMLRTEWRVLFHLGRFGQMTAREICDRAGLHKTKVSRAVKALEGRRFLLRSERPDDRRQEALSLTPAGKAAYRDLSGRAQDYDAALSAQFDVGELAVLRRCLKHLAGL